MLTAEQENERRQRSALADELARLGVRFAGKNCSCPYHDDAHPSAGVYRDSDGVWRFKCHGCGVSGDVFDLRARNAGRELKDVLKTEAPEPPKVFPSVEAISRSLATCEAVYQYTNPETKQPDLVVFRYRRAERKAFAQGRPEGSGFVLKAPQGLLPIYNRTRLKDASEVLVVEGEKCVHALHEIGLVATTSPGGAGKAKHADWTPLKDKTVYLWPDNDAADSQGRSKGVEHMRDVETILLPLGCDVRWIDHAQLNLPEKGDCVDFLAANEGTRADKLIAVQLLMEEASGANVTDDLEARLADMAQGRWKNHAFPWPKLTYLAKALLPGTVTCLPGDGGDGKSFLLLEAAWHWHLSGIKVALYELEEDRTYHLHRALAQIDGNSSLVDDEWVRGHKAETGEAFMRQRDLLEGFGRRITDAPDRMVTLDELAAWVERRFDEGCEIVAVDPVTAAQVGDKPWLDDQRFMFRVKTAARRTGGRLILVTHPRITQVKSKNPHAANMAGGASFGRFSQTVLWLRKHPEPKRATVYTTMGYTEQTFERSLYVTKARNGSGAGAEIAFCLDPTSLCFSEIGVVREEKVKVGVS
jgi:AAA domain/CHC2 zinc finger